MGQEHYHLDQKGFAHRCYHRCKNLVADWSFWFGLTVGFPIEHWLWEKVPLFVYITRWLGL